MTTDPADAGPARADEPGADPTRPTEGFAALALRGVPLVVAGVLLGGLPGAAVALVGVGASFRRPTGPLTVAAGGLLVAACVGTLVEAPLTRAALNSGFADERPVASACATSAGILLLVVAVTLLVRLPRTPPLDPDGSDEAPPPAPLGARLRPLLAPVALGLVAFVVLGLSAPPPPAATRAVAATVRSGQGWGYERDGVVVVDATEPPLPVAVVAAAPGPTRWWTATAGLVAMVAIGIVVRRRVGDRTALLAAAVTGLALVVVRADLAGTVAAALVATALALGDPDDRTVGRAALAGAAFGGLCLCLPAALFLLPVLAAALALHPRTGEVSVGQGVAAVTATLVVVAPWQLWVLERASTWAPAAQLVVPGSVVAGALVPLLVLVAALLAGRGPEGHRGDGTAPGPAAADEAASGVDA